MKPYIFLISCSIAISPLATSAEEGKPKIKFDDLIFDFGTTTQVQSVTGKFHYQNDGNGVLEISKPKPSCGCTVAGVDPSTLKPGDRGELAFSLNLSNIRGKSQKRITVPSNDPEKPEVVLTVKVDVVPTFDVRPRNVNLGDFQKGKEITKTVTVKRLDGKKLIISKIEAMHNLVTATIDSSNETADDQSASIMISPPLDGEPRRINDIIQLYAEDAPNELIKIPVMGRMVGDLSVNPEELSWAILNTEGWDGKLAERFNTRQFVVSATEKGQHLEVKNPVSTFNGMTLEVETIEAGETYAVIAKLKNPPKESMEGSITFETNFESQPKVTVPVNINVFER